MTFSVSLVLPKFGSASAVQATKALQPGAALAPAQPPRTEYDELGWYARLCFATLTPNLRPAIMTLCWKTMFRTQQPWTPEQKKLISAHVEQSAELMNMCIEAAKGKFGDRFEDEAIIRDLAISLYLEAIRKY